MTDAEECLEFLYCDLLKLREWANEDYRYDLSGAFLHYYMLGREAGICNALSVKEWKSIKLRAIGFMNEAKFLRYEYRRDL